MSFKNIFNFLKQLFFKKRRAEIVIHEQENLPENDRISELVFLAITFTNVEQYPLDIKDTTRPITEKVKDAFIQHQYPKEKFNKIKVNAGLMPLPLGIKTIQNIINYQFNQSK